MTTERYFATATATQLADAARACREAADVADTHWDGEHAEWARRFTSELDWSWDFDSWSNAASILEREWKLAARA